MGLRKYFGFCRYSPLFPGILYVAIIEHHFREPTAIVENRKRHHTVALNLPERCGARLKGTGTPLRRADANTAFNLD